VTSTGTGDIQDIDVGLTTDKVRRNWSELEPSVSYALSERSWVALRYRLTDVEFGDVGQSGLVDYQQHYVSGVYSYRLTVANDLEVVVLGAQYRPASGTDSDTEQLLAGIVHRFSPTANAGFRAGIGKTTETTPDGNVDTSGYVLEARAAQEAELSRLEAVISHDIQPSGIDNPSRLTKCALTGIRCCLRPRHFGFGRGYCAARHLKVRTRRLMHVTLRRRRSELGFGAGVVAWRQLPVPVPEIRCGSGHGPKQWRVRLGFLGTAAAEVTNPIQC